MPKGATYPDFGTYQKLGSANGPSFAYVIGSDENPNDLLISFDFLKFVRLNRLDLTYKQDCLNSASFEFAEINKIKQLAVKKV